MSTRTRGGRRPGQALQRLDARHVDLSRLIRMKGMNNRRARRVKWRDRALATSASPPLLAKGTTSDAMAQLIFHGGAFRLGSALVALRRFNKVSIQCVVCNFFLGSRVLLVSLGVGVFTADLPFWRRALQLPLPADGAYLPVAVIGTPGTASPGESAPVNDAFDTLVVEESVNRARGAGSRALLVMYRGRLAIERYFVTDDATSLLPAALVARPLAAMAVGLALADGRIASLDSSVARYLPEWDEEARGHITIRQPLEETSGLETGGDIRGLFYRSRGILRACRRSDLEGRANVASESSARLRLEHSQVAFTPFAGQHAARRGHRRTRHGHAFRKLSTNACGAWWVLAARNCSSTGAPACPRRIAAGALRHATCCAY
jgi:hypothetical protein